MTSEKKTRQTFKNIDWWSQDQSKETKAKWKQAVEKYCSIEQIEPDELSPDIQTVKSMIPVVAIFDDRWLMFDANKFNTNSYKCHDNLYHTLINKINSLQKEILQQR